MANPRRAPEATRPVVLALLIAAGAATSRAEPYEIVSPGSALSVRVEVGEQLRWSVHRAGRAVLRPSAIALHLGDGTSLGPGARVVSDAVEHVDSEIAALNYVRSVVQDDYTQLSLEFEGDFGVRFRAYDDAVAYRFVTRRDGELIVRGEQAQFDFGKDLEAFVPYMWDYRGGHVFNSSFESPYTESRLSEWKQGSLSILPMVVTLEDGARVEILEADLESYPGMYLKADEAGTGLEAVFPQYPLEVEPGGFRGWNLIPTQRADYIAKTEGTRSFPWRVAIVVDRDQDLLSHDVVQRLASPSRIEDASWIEPGQVAWDWWDGYNLFGVDFEAGLNTATFLHYVDFAAENGAKYVILDGGWTDEHDLHAVNPDIDLERVLAHAKQKNVGVILWALWSTLVRQMEEVFPKYAAMGVRGWKIDFIDRDDQLAVESTYEMARLAAEHRMFVDYHGVFKPTGLQRTYPNVLGYEGVYGLENFKWADTDAPRYAVTIPFIRNVAGPMDYTSGALRNVTQAGFKARDYAPMAKGTRCHQLAQYVVFEVPLQMLSDSPTLYRREQESTDFITAIPTTFDESVPLAGEIGEYVAIARRKGGTWYVGAMTNWTPRELSLDLSFLGGGAFEAEVFADGVNAAREATDYTRSVMPVSVGTRLDVRMAPGGGWAAIIRRR